MYYLYTLSILLLHVYQNSHICSSSLLSECKIITNIIPSHINILSIPPVHTTNHTYFTNNNLNKPSSNNHPITTSIKYPPSNIFLIVLFWLMPHSYTNIIFSFLLLSTKPIQSSCPYTLNSCYDESIPGWYNKSRMYSCSGTCFIDALYMDAECFMDSSSYLDCQVLEAVLCCQPTLNPTPTPTDNPTAPTFTPSSSPTNSPSDIPSNAPSISPSSFPSTVPSLAPSIAPTQPPTKAPSFSPSSAPSIAPTSSPTACVDYTNGKIKYNSNDGTDLSKTVDIMNEIQKQFMINYNDSIINYTATFNTHYYGSTIQCDKNDNYANICLIQCHIVGFCTELFIHPKSKSIVNLFLECTKKYSCKSSTINYTSSLAPNLEEIVISCIDSLSCNHMSINLELDKAANVVIYCVNPLSCQYLAIATQYLTINNNVAELNIICVADNACDYLQVIMNENVNANLLIYKNSQDIMIKTAEYKRVNIECGNQNDSRYLRYDTWNLLDVEELLLRARQEYTSSHLPCEDIEIICINMIDDEIYEQNCKMQYKLSDAVDLIEIINTTRSCYWIDIGLLYNPVCIGSCGNNFTVYTHPIKINSELRLSLDSDDEDDAKQYFKNGTIDNTVCSEYFGDINTTHDTLSDIEVIFSAVLNLYKDREEIHSVFKAPSSSLTYNVSYVNCSIFDMDKDSILITTEFEIESSTNSPYEMNTLFSEDSLFYQESNKLLNAYFENSINVFPERNNTFDITIINTYLLTAFGTTEWRDDVEIYEEIWFIPTICGISLLLIVMLLVIICYYRKHKQIQLERERLAIYIKNPMVITIAIGYYEESRFQDLDTDVDIKHLAILFKETLNYAMNPPFDKNCIKLDWKQKELMEYLVKKAIEFNEKKDFYDGLVVVLSGHGIKDYIITADCKKIEKNAIHRIFSYHFPEIRQKPRLFIFDSCDGSAERNYLPRGASLDTDDEYETDNLTSIHLDNLDNLDDLDDVKDDVGEYDDICINGKVVDLKYIASLTKSDEYAWNKYEENPDYQLALCFAANPGFQAKMDCLKGSYMITQFVEKMIENIEENNQRFLFQIFEDVQDNLHKTGKQLSVNTFNNNTRYIRFMVNKDDHGNDGRNDNIEDKSDDELEQMICKSAGNVVNSDKSLKVDHMVEMITINNINDEEQTSTTK